MDLMENADRQRSAFMSFVNIWMAFNGWMAAVTGREADVDMIRALATNVRLVKAYTTLMETSRPFYRLSLRSCPLSGANGIHGRRQPSRQLMTQSGHGGVGHQAQFMVR